MGSVQPCSGPRGCQKGRVLWQSSHLSAAQPQSHRLPPDSQTPDGGARYPATVTNPGELGYPAPRWPWIGGFTYTYALWGTREGSGQITRTLMLNARKVSMA